MHSTTSPSIPVFSRPSLVNLMKDFQLLPINHREYSLKSLCPRCVCISWALISFLLSPVPSLVYMPKMDFQDISSMHIQCQIQNILPRSFRILSLDLTSLLCLTHLRFTGWDIFYGFYYQSQTVQLQCLPQSFFHLVALVFDLSTSLAISQFVAETFRSLLQMQNAISKIFPQLIYHSTAGHNILAVPCSTPSSYA